LTRGADSVRDEEDRDNALLLLKWSLSLVVTWAPLGDVDVISLLKCIFTPEMPFYAVTAVVGESYLGVRKAPNHSHTPLACCKCRIESNRIESNRS